MADPEPEPTSWRSDQLAIGAAVATVASPVAFLFFGWLIGAAVAGVAAALSVVVFLSARVERLELEQRAREAETALTRERGAKARFMSVLSHDLRQPIHAMSLYITALNKRVESEEARGIVDKIDRAAQAAATLISNVDAYARFDARVFEPKIEPCALQRILDEVSSAYPGVSAPTTALRVRTDEALLRGTLNRLAENAERYGGGGRIEVREDGDVAEISVVDDGQGITTDQHERIFEEFVRLDGARRGEGFGLGLPVARRLGKLLNTDVRVKSTPGEGATFSVRVPIAR